MLNIVLYQPEKPANTGNIIRTCMCFDMRLHIIGPITFSFDDKQLKRAQMDYVKDCDITFYDNYEDFNSRNYKGQFVYFSRYGLKTFDECKFNKDEDIYIMFGKESTGIPKSILKGHLFYCLIFRNYFYHYFLFLLHFLFLILFFLLLFLFLLFYFLLVLVLLVLFLFLY